MARKDKGAESREDIEIAGIDETLSEEGGGSRVYELGFHLDPELPSEEVKKAYQAIKEEVGKQGSLVAEGDPEKIPLAYTISRQEQSGRRDFDSSFFAWIAYETSAPNHAKVLEAAKADVRIFRFIDVITSKDAARHAAEMRLMAAKVPEPEDKEAVSDTELDAALEAAAA